MHATITNTGSTAFFIPGPDINLDPGESKVIPDVVVNDLDENTVLKSKVLAGVATVTVTDDTTDATGAVQGSLAPAGLGAYLYANLPVGYDGRVVYCTNGRKTGEGAGAGTGVPAYYSAGAWHVFYDDSVLAV